MPRAGCRSTGSCVYRADFLARPRVLLRGLAADIRDADRRHARAEILRSRPGYHRDRQSFGQLHAVHQPRHPRVRSAGAGVPVRHHRRRALDRRAAARDPRTLRAGAASPVDRLEHRAGGGLAVAQLEARGSTSDARQTRTTDRSRSRRCGGTAPSRASKAFALAAERDGGGISSWDSSGIFTEIDTYADAG